MSKWLCKKQEVKAITACHGVLITNDVYNMGVGNICYKFIILRSLLQEDLADGWMDRETDEEIDGWIGKQIDR